MTLIVPLILTSMTSLHSSAGTSQRAALRLTVPALFKSKSGRTPPCQDVFGPRSNREVTRNVDNLEIVWFAQLTAQFLDGASSPAAPNDRMAEFCEPFGHSAAQTTCHPGY